MKKRLLVFLFLIPCYVFPQYQQQSLFVYNVGFGALTSGIGAVINKPKHSDWKKYFIKGFWQGSIGGLLHFTGKKTIYLITKEDNVLYGWPAKILHSAGSSIIENAALDEPFLQNWNIDYGPARFDFSTNNQRKFQIRFLPEFVYSMIATARLKDGRNNYAKFDLRTTLLSGTFAFKGEGGIFYRNDNILGASNGRSFAYGDYSNFNNPISSDFQHQIIAHEYVHILQYNEFQVFNSWLKPLVDKIKPNKTKDFIVKYIYPDIPYVQLPYGIARLMETKNHYSNFFEFEAQSFSTNKFVQR